MANKAKRKYFILLMILKNGNFKIIEAIKKTEKIVKLIIKLTLDKITNKSIPAKNINE